MKKLRVLLFFSLLFVGPAAGSSDAQETATRERARLLGEAGAALSDGRVGDAEAILRRLAEERSVRALLWLSKIEMGRGRALEARRLLDRALEIAPHAEQLLRAYAQAALASQAPVAAILVLEPLVRMYPEDGDYQYWLGVALLQLGDVYRAAEVLERALPLQERADKALFGLALAQNKLKRYAEARESLEESLRIEPGEVEVMAALSESLQGLGEKEEAERLARRVLELEPEHATAHLVLGLLRMDENAYEAAARAFEASTAADPEEPRAHYQLSLAYARLGEREKSEQELELYREARQAIEDRLKSVDRESVPAQPADGNEEGVRE